MSQTEFAVRKKATRLLMAALLFELISLVLYSLTGVTEFTPTLSARVLIFGCAALLLGAVLLVGAGRGKAESAFSRILDLGVYMVYALGLLAWLFYLTNEINYLANIMVAIDGTALSPVFVINTVLFLAAWLCALLSAMAFGKTRMEGGRDQREVVEHA